MSKAKRSKNFATIIYPESCPDDFLDLIRDCKVNFLLSPLHDRDVSSDGTLKKPHYHLIFVFDSLKSCDQVKDLFGTFGGVGCEIVNSLVSYARYLIHLDDPDKCQYSSDDVVAYGIDYQSFIVRPSDKYDLMARVIDFCESSGCTSFRRLLLYARHEDFEMFKLLCDNSYVIREFLRCSREDLKDDDLDLHALDFKHSSRLDDDGNPFYDD